MGRGCKDTNFLFNFANMKKAYVFPGQGSQFTGMAKDLYESSPLAKKMLEDANDILGFRITDIMFNGTADDLKATKVTQPAVFLHSVVMAECLRDGYVPEGIGTVTTGGPSDNGVLAAGDSLAGGLAAGALPDMVAGHSLGEFSALVCCGALSFEEGLKLVSVRAQAMQKACEANPGAMAAVIGLPDDVIEKVCAEVSGGCADVSAEKGADASGNCTGVSAGKAAGASSNCTGVSAGKAAGVSVPENGCGIVVAANYNCPGQVVISGNADAVWAACEALKAAGARRALTLPVSGAFHSPLMEMAREELAQGIRAAKFNTPLCPIYQNVTGAPSMDPEVIKENLLKQLTSPVRWTQSVRAMIADGAGSFVELGPGKVLQGLIGRIIA